MGANTAHTVTIQDNDTAQPTVQFAQVTSNGPESTTSVSITVLLSASYTSDIYVDYDTTGGTATSGTDYTALNAQLTIPAGATSANITLPVTNDALDEDDETVQITLTNPVNASLRREHGAYLYDPGQRRGAERGLYGCQLCRR